MSAIDVEKLSQPVTVDSPCGEDLAYDLGFQELERAAAVDGGNFIVPGGKEPEPPNWRNVGELAETLLGQTKDLRVAMYLTKARLNTHGVAALGDGVALIKALLTNYWSDVHPRLDAEDNNDPTMRLNSLLGLVDTGDVIRYLRQVPMVKGKQAGSYSLRDYRIATGEIAAPGGAQVPDTGIISGAFKEADLDELRTAASSYAQAIQDLHEIEGFITEQVGPTNNTLTVKPLADELRAISKIYTEQLQARGVIVESKYDAVASDRGLAQHNAGEVNSREDAIRMIDKVSEYFRRNEPSSPVPILLQRAKGLVAKDFMEILRDLTPGAISQAELYSRPAKKD